MVAALKAESSKNTVEICTNCGNYTTTIYQKKQKTVQQGKVFKGTKQDLGIRYKNNSILFPFCQDSFFFVPRKKETAVLFSLICCSFFSLQPIQTGLTIVCVHHLKGFISSVVLFLPQKKYFSPYLQGVVVAAQGERFFYFFVKETTLYLGFGSNRIFFWITPPVFCVNRGI